MAPKKQFALPSAKSDIDVQSPALNRLADQIGLFIEYWGFKKIHGMIWTHLYLSDDPLTAKDLIRRLKVSKALVSLSIKDLLDYELVLISQTPGNKKNKYYSANPDVFRVIHRVLQTREMNMLNRIQSELQAVQSAQSTLTSADDGVSADRLVILSEMVGGAKSMLSNLLELSSVNPDFLGLWCDRKDGS